MSWGSFAFGVVVGVLLVVCCFVAWIVSLAKEWDEDDPHW